MEQQKTTRNNKKLQKPPELKLPETIEYHRKPLETRRNQQNH